MLVPLRLEANTMRSPVGDQNGVVLIEPSVVKRCSVPRLKSHRHRSWVVFMTDARRNKIDLSSGEIAGSKTKEGEPTAPSSLPPRSYQTIWFRPTSPPLSYSSSPVSETVT